MLGQRIVAHPDLDAAARLALFRACHALARTTLLHAPGSKRHTASIGYHTGQEWSAKLARLLGAKWQPLPLGSVDLDLRITFSSALYPTLHSRLPPPPPTSLSHHVSRLHLQRCYLTVSHLAAWQLHDAALWPHLQHLTIDDCDVPRFLAQEEQPLQPIPRLQSFRWELRLQTCGFAGQYASGVIDFSSTLLPLVTNTRRLHVRSWWAEWEVELVTQLQHLTHVDLSDTRPRQPFPVDALLRHPTLEHLVLRHALVYRDLSRQPCRGGRWSCTTWSCPT